MSIRDRLTRLYIDVTRQIDPYIHDEVVIGWLLELGHDLENNDEAMFYVHERTLARRIEQLGRQMGP